jgi:hypothetical protein
MEKKYMAKHLTNAIIQTNLNEHPAVKAWRKLRPKWGDPERITVLKEIKKSKKSAVYRLEGITTEDTAVIAKRCRKETGLIESVIYEKILSQLPITSLKYYGFVEEEKICWLFVEDAGDEEYSRSNAEHRAVAGRWLGLMHTTAARVASAARLPDRGPIHYLAELQMACNKTQKNLGNSRLTADDVAVLERIISQCMVLELHWSHVERLCEGMPRTLVHSDFQLKNVRTRIRHDGIALLTFDWEIAGWGVPAADITQFACRSISPDIDIYSSVVRDVWPSLDGDAIRCLTQIGKLFRYLTAIRWEAHHLFYEWIDQSMQDMRYYETKLTEAIQEVGWKG